MKNQWLLLGLGLAALAVAGAGWLIASQPYAFHGSTIEPPMRVADFTLTSHAGTQFRLADQTGKIVVLFFGYTSCPDFCPTTLMEFKKVRARLVREAEHTQFVFITVDPERDTPDKLRAYLNSFDPAFIGLTGTEAELAPVWRTFGVFREKKPGASALGYSMDHSTTVYVIDQRGNLRLTYSYGETADDMAQDVNYLVSELHAAP